MASFYVDIIAYDTTKIKADPIKVCLGDTIHLQVT
jgi:hypothetical protein